jgi:hypothetical protein
MTCLVRAAVQRPPERADARGDARVEVRARAADDAHRARRAVLLVVGVQQQEQVERAREHGIHLVALARRREHHVQEVRAVVEIVAGVHQRLPARVLVRVRRDRRHLRHQADGRVVDALLGLGLLVERGEGADGGGADRHRVRVVRQRVEEAPEVLVEHRPARDRALEQLELARRRQLALDQQPRHLEERALLGQFLDRVPAVPQDAALAVDEGDGALARAGVAEARVEVMRPVCCRSCRMSIPSSPSDPRTSGSVIVRPSYCSTSVSGVTVPSAGMLRPFAWDLPRARGGVTRG